MRSVIITGTSKGIGLETALAFGRAGYRVYATMRNPEGADAFRQLIKDESLPITISRLDVTSDESVKQAMDDIYRENGPVDILVNNAGIERHSSVEELDLSEFKEVMETNYFGAIRCIKYVVPAMRNNRDGCIINITSVAGKIAPTPLGAYSASKFALEALSEALAQELKQFNVRVCIVEPGIIDTQMARDISGGEKSVYPQTYRFGRLFSASLKTPVHPSLVGEKILDVAHSGTWKLRHPVGPDAEPFLAWRASMNDEQWVDWNAVDDTTWYNAVEGTFGLNARPEVSSTVHV